MARVGELEDFRQADLRMSQRILGCQQAPPRKTCENRTNNNERGRMACGSKESDRQDEMPLPDADSA
jgi:hypothetical protein